jgi:hypothetical protein
MAPRSVPDREETKESDSQPRMNRAGAQKAIPVTACATATLLARAEGQVIGEDICASAPSMYEFTFDFALTCPPVNVTQGNAVEATSCFVSPFGRSRSY